MLGFVCQKQVSLRCNAERVYLAYLAFYVFFLHFLSLSLIIFQHVLLELTASVTIRTARTLVWVKWNAVQIVLVRQRPSVAANCATAFIKQA